MRGQSSRLRLNARRRLLLESLEDRRPLVGDANLTPATYDLRSVVDLDATVSSSNPTAAVQIGSSILFTATTATYGTELWKTDGTNDGTSIVKDLVTGTDSANPRSLYQWNGNLYFVSEYSYIDPIAPPGGLAETRTGIFRSDGTEAGTVLVHSFTSMGGPGLPGATDNTTFFSLGSQLLFLRPDSMAMGGQELWKTNGISGATVIGSIPSSAGPGMPSSSIMVPSVTLGSVLLFNVNIDSSSGGHQLWRTDGTVAGTFLLRQSEMSFGPGSLDFDGSLVSVGSTVYFVSNSMMEGQELWRTDGTLAGTRLVSDLVVGSQGSQIGSMVAFQNQLHFTASNNNDFSGPNFGRELYRADPVTDVLTRITDIVPAGADGIHGKLFPWQGNLYFAGGDGGSGDGIELWKSDGTAGGTSQVVNIAPGSSGFFPASSIPSSFVDLGSRFTFQTSMSGPIQGRLWSSDGTSTGTVQLTTESVSAPLRSGNRLYFSSTTALHGSELWSTDGTALGTSMIKDLNPGAADTFPGILATTTTGVVFTGTNPSLGSELGISDGTNSGTRLIDVARGTPAADIRDVLKVGNDFYISTRFTAGSFTDKLYRTNSVTGVTTLLKTFAPGDGPTELTFGSGQVYFAAEGAAAQGRELWQTDGTVAGTKLSKDIRVGTTDSNPRKMTAFDNRVFFVVNGASGFEELWASNGGDINPAVFIAQFNVPGNSGVIQSLTVVGERLYVVAGGQLHRFNRQVNGGTTKVTLGATRQTGNVMGWDNVVYYSGYSVSHGDELWRTDGTVVGTYLVKDLFPGPDSSHPGGGVVASGVPSDSQGTGAAIEAKLIFRALAGTDSSQLWSSDGTSDGTKQLTSIAVVDGSGNTQSLAPVNLVSLGDKVLFEGFSPGAGRELWISNGTQNGTKLLADLRPGIAPDPSDPMASSLFNMRESTAVGNQAFFRTVNAANGEELWVSDGTSAGSKLAVDGITGVASSRPSNLFADNGRLYLTADTRDYGVTSAQSGAGELFYVNQSPRVALMSTTAVPAGTTTSIGLQASDRDGDTVSFEIATPPSHGTASIVGQTLHYTPAPGFAGIDTLVYRALDASLASAPATMRFNVQASPYTASFAASSSNTTEQNGNFQVTVNLDRPATQDILVPYTFSGDTENVFGGVSGGDLIIPVGETSAVINIALEDDNRYEANPDLLVVSIDDEGFVRLGPTSSHTVSIANNDSVPTVRFDKFDAAVSESDITTSFDVVLSHPSESPVTVQILASGALGAVAGTDFVFSTPQTVTFLPGQVSKTVPVRIVQDSLAENREVIVFDLGTVTGATLSSIPQSWKHILWIDDNDTSTISIDTEHQYLIEGSTATITATRSGGNLSNALIVPFTYFPRGAVFGTDYTANQPNAQFNFAAGSTTATVSFTLTDDTIVETYEAFEILLSAGSYTIAGRGSAWIDIGDNDVSTPTISLDSPNVSERSVAGVNRTVDVIVRLSNPSVSEVTVPIRVSDYSGIRTATRNTDFQFSTTDFVFAPGVTEIRRAVTILDDSSVESDETLRFTLGNSLFTGPLWQSKQSVELTIQDDDFTSSIVAPTSVNENAGSFTFDITKETANAIGGNLVVNLGGRVTFYGNNADVTVAAANGTTINVPFGTADTKRTYTVQVHDDNKVEGPEKLVLQVGRYLGTQFQVLDTHEITIADNDRRPTVSFGKTGGFGLTGTSSVQIPVELSAPVTVPARVFFNLGGDAKRGTDYRLEGTLPGQLAIDFGPGDSVGYVTIQPLPRPAGSQDKTVDVILTGAIALDIPDNPPKSSHVIPGTKTQTAPKTKTPPSTKPAQAQQVFTPGTLAISLGGTSGAVLSPSIGNNSSGVVTPTNLSNSPILPGTLAIFFGEQGLLEGSTAFLDANFNGLRDFIDIDEDGRRDEGEILEPMSITQLDGSFALPMLPELDRNSDGVIDASEGRTVINGGIDTSTGLAWEMPMATTVGSFVVSPLTTLLENYARRFGFSPSQASTRIQEAFRIEGFDFSTSDPLTQLLAGNGVSKQVYVQQVQVSSLMILLARLTQGAGDRNFAALTQLAADALVDRIADNGSIIDLTEPSVVLTIARALNQSLTTPIPSNTLADASTLIAARLDDLRQLVTHSFPSEQAFLQQLTRYKKTLHGSMANDLRDVGNGTKTIAQVSATYATPQIPILAAAQTIGQVIPTLVAVTDAVVMEGATGETSILRFEVGLVGDHESPVSVDFATRDFSATAGSDYTSHSGTLTWPVGDNTSRFIEVTIHGDDVFEVDDSLVLGLDNAIGAVIRRHAGFGYILNDDDAVHNITSTSSTETSISNSSDSLSVLENNSLITSGFHARPTNLTIVGEANQTNVTNVVFDPTGYRDDHYTIVGGTQSDTLRMVGGAFRTIEVVPSTNARTIVATTESYNAIVIDSTNVEDAIAEVTTVDSVDVYLPAGVTSVIVEDASAGDTGMMKVRSATGEFLPFVFTNPTQSIKIVSTNPSVTVQELSRDPLFLGTVTLSMRDFGDAPASFPTTVASRAASHEAIGPRLGTSRDVEIDGQPSASASGDGGDDDGAMFGAIVPHSPAGINVNLQNATQGKVDAWIDFNGDGVWETSEKVLDSVSVVSGLQTLNYTVPAATSGLVVARIRVSTLGGLSPNGYASDGEVEDYVVTIGPRVATPTGIVSGNATSRSELSRIQVQFDSIVNAVPSDFMLRNTTTNKIVTGINVALDNSTGSTHATLTFTSGESIVASNHASILPTLANGSYELLYRPISLGSSADAIAVDSFFRKFGDSNGDNIVALSDFAAFRGSFGKVYDGNNLNNGYRSDLDFDRNGMINLADFAAFRGVFGT